MLLPARIAPRIAAMIGMGSVLLAGLLAAPPARAGEEKPAAAPAAARLPEGSWSLWKGGLKVTTRRAGEDPEVLQGSLEVAYLALGAPPGAPSGAQSGAPSGTSRSDAERQVLLLRRAESPESRELAVTEAVTLIENAGGLRPVIAVEDRAMRISPVLFSHLPLDIFPPAPPGADARSWKGPAPLHVLSPLPQPLSASHRVEAGPGGTARYRVEADAGQRSSIPRDRVEVDFEVERLSVEWVLEAGSGRVLEHRSRLEGRVLGAEGAAARLEREVELARSELQDVQGPRWEALRGEARALQEIERALFVLLDAEAAQARASDFEKEHGGSRLARFAAGLALQADAVAPLRRERRLYGKPAPDFTLQDLQGRPVTLSQVAPGKVTYLTFWSVG